MFRHGPPVLAPPEPVQAWQAVHPGGDYVYRDLVADPVAPVDEDRVHLSTRSSAHGVRDLETMDEVAAGAPGPARSWAAIRPLAEQLLAADVLLLGAPMYDFSVPAALKAWIDRVTLPWLPLKGKMAVVLSARGGGYAPGTPRERFDFQEPYLRAYFSALGLDDVEFVHAELTHAAVEVLIANAVRWGGDGPPSRGVRFEDVPLREWDVMIGANLVGTAASISAVLSGMRARGWGRIVLLSSGVAEEGLPGPGPYGTAKSGLHGLAGSPPRSVAADGSRLPRPSASHRWRCRSSR